MILSLEGKITMLSEDFLCVFLSGITWELNISRNTYQHYVNVRDAGNSIAQESKGEDNSTQASQKVYTYLHANDKGLTLYGFASLAERSIFLSLQKVDGIGPKAALKILSHTTPETLISSIKSKDPKSLSAISGIGAKKASRILLTLEGVYVSSSVQSQKTDVSPTDSAFEHEYRDIVMGLVKMGYDRNLVVKVMSQHAPEFESEGINIDEGALMHKVITYIENRVD